MIKILLRFVSLKVIRREEGITKLKDQMKVRNHLTTKMRIRLYKHKQCFSKNKKQCLIKERGTQCQSNKTTMEFKLTTKLVAMQFNCIPKLK